MHVLLIPIGSHGDVHPFVGLGTALKARGHRVTLITNAAFAALAERAGLTFVPLGDEASFREATENPDLWKPMKGFRLVMSMVGRLVKPLHEIIASLNEPGETVMAAQVTAWGARIAHESLNIPLATVHLQPAVFTSAIDPPHVPFRSFVAPFPLWLRRKIISYLELKAVDPLLAPPINECRREHGLPPINHVPVWWHSPQRVLGLFPDWFAKPAADWPQNTVLAGFPLFDESGLTVLDPEVDAFLNAGPPPVVFTAGSAMLHGAAFFQAAVDACARIDRRAILLARFADQIPSPLPNGIRHFHYVPFSQILPRCAALVHHGGIGTTAQGLAAGLPQLVMPLAHDQPDNAARLKTLGVGDSLRPSRFNARAVARKLEPLLSDPIVADRAKSIAQRVAPAESLAIACRTIEGLIDAPIDPPSQ